MTGSNFDLLLSISEAALAGAERKLNTEKNKKQQKYRSWNDVKAILQNGEVFDSDLGQIKVASRFKIGLRFCATLSLIIPFMHLRQLFND